jgi:hypothetical protein
MSDGGDDGGSVVVQSDKSVFSEIQYYCMGWCARLPRTASAKKKTKWLTEMLKRKWSAHRKEDSLCGMKVRVESIGYVGNALANGNTCENPQDPFDRPKVSTVVTAGVMLVMLVVLLVSRGEVTSRK